MLIFAERIRNQVGDHSARDLLSELHSYFNLPMTAGDRFLAIFLVLAVTVLIVFITFKAIKNIWKGDDKKKLL